MLPSLLTTAPSCLLLANNIQLSNWQPILFAATSCHALLSPGSRDCLPPAGNGIQNILYKTGDIMYVSLHR